MTVCNMSIEAGARAGLIAPDETTFDYLRGRRARRRATDVRTAPSRTGASSAATTARASTARCASTRATIQPDRHLGHASGPGGRVDRPRAGATTPTATRPRRATTWAGTPGAALAGRPVDVVFVGSCTNSRLSRPARSRRVLRGRRVHPRVRMLVVPGSEQVKREAEAEGIDRIVRDAGAEWREPGCSMCIAMNGDLVGPGQLAVSHQQPQLRGPPGQGRAHRAGLAADRRRVRGGRRRSPIRARS